MFWLAFPSATDNDEHKSQALMDTEARKTIPVIWYFIRRGACLYEFVVWLVWKSVIAEFAGLNMATFRLVNVACKENVLFPFLKGFDDPGQEFTQLLTVEQFKNAAPHTKLTVQKERAFCLYD